MKDVDFIEEFEDKGLVTYVPGGCQFNAMRVFNVRLFVNFFSGCLKKTKLISLDL